MSKFANLIKVIGVVGVIVMLGLLVGWLASKRTVVHSSITPPSTTPPPHASAPELPRNFPVTNRVRPRHVNADSTNRVISATMPENVLTNWEDKVDEILGSQDEDSAKARQMLQLFPRLPAEGQVEVAQHLSNLTADEDFAGLAQYATNSALPEDVLEVFLDDLLNRPNSVKLPTLLDIARDEQHAKAADAKELLELFLEEDYGKDWPKWQAKMQEWLQENPD